MDGALTKKEAGDTKKILDENNYVRDMYYLYQGCTVLAPGDQDGGIEGGDNLGRRREVEASGQDIFVGTIDVLKFALYSNR